jgi:hypothetical protein
MLVTADVTELNNAAWAAIVAAVALFSVIEIALTDFAVVPA